MFGPVEQRVKILDFGVVKKRVCCVLSRGSDMKFGAKMTILTSGDAGVTWFRSSSGGELDDGMAHLNSLGLVFDEMLGGQHPFLTDSFAGTVGRVLHLEPPSLHEINHSVPAPLAGIVEHMLAKDPASRYPTAQDLLADLDAVERGDKPVFGGLPSKPARSRRERSLSAVEGSADRCCTASLLVVLLFFSSGRDSDTPPIRRWTPVVRLWIKT